MIQILLFGASAIYLHHQSDNYGFAPLLFFVAGLMGVLNIIELLAFNIEILPGIDIRLGGHVYIPIILLIVLTVFITSGTRTARITIAGLIGIDVLIVSVLLFLSLAAADALQLAGEFFTCWARPRCGQRHPQTQLSCSYPRLGARIHT
ncbi:MAG: hypothetical protein KJ065_11860 [Anaerolineae bacterium]|nr:hypothetical protein [Anaerolineae bacterium]